jgi:hypothetical protein
LELERSQPVGPIDYGFFGPATALIFDPKIEDEDEFEDENDNKIELVWAAGKRPDRKNYRLHTF